MATTNNIPFSSLDPLGPEYGKINAPITDAKGLTAFEGDRINTPQINFPESEQFVPIMPNIGNLDNPTQEIKKNVVGIPPGKQGLNKKARYDQLAKSMDAYARNMLRANQDKNQYAKIYSYNADPDGNAFYKRYHAYGQEKFDQIGFSPLRDNEALFNARTTKWDDFSRMMTNSFVPLFSRGFVSGPKSLGKMLTGDFTGTDLEDAAAYEEAAAIGQSTKGGFFGFANNSLMNFSYSAGIITEAVAEEVALTLASIGTAGGALPALFARTAMNAQRIGKSLKGFDRASDGLRAINKTLDQLGNVKGAREFWNATKGFRNKVNPLSNTFEAYRLANQADNITNLAKASKTFGGFYRDVRNINMALSEARLEGGMVENHIYDNLYNEYYAKNGEAPSNELQEEMMKQAKKGAVSTVYWNAGIIWASNLITFPNIVGPKGGLRNFAKTTVKELSEVSGGKFGKLGNVVYDQATKKFKFEKNNLVNWAKGWVKNPIYKSVGNTVGYFKSNFTEGIQENLQEVIAGANERYYTDTFKSQALQAHNYSKAVSQYDYFSDELSKQFSSQGFETFASGFAMGAFAAPLNKSFEYLGIGYNKMFDKQAYQELKNKKLEITRDLVNNLNNIDIKDFLNSRVFNYGRQDIISKIKESGSKKEALDADHEGLLEQMDMLLRNGSFDTFKEKLYDLQQLTPEEFEDNVPNVPKGEGAKYQAKITETIEKMDRINNRYKTYQEKFKNPVDPENLPPKGTPEYNNAVTLYNAWEETVKNAVFFNETFEDVIKRKKEILERFNSQKPLQSMTQRDSEVIFDHDKLRNEIGLLKNEIEALKGLTDPMSKEELAKKQKKLKALEQLGEATVNFTNFFKRNEKAAEIRQILQKEKGEVPVTDEEIEAVMDQYFGKYDDDNKIKQASKYETAFKNYLKTIAGLNNDYLFDESIDDAFQLLADHHKLDSEARNLMKGVNLLHDPGGFLDLVERNQKWMKDLYARKGEYYQKMITEQFDIVVDNALLNALANRSIYISLDEFTVWKKEGIPPSEFYDHARKIIVPEGTPEYEDYYMLFEQAASLKAEKSSPIPSSLDQELEAELENLNKQKEQEINNVPKVDTKVSQGFINSDKSGVITPKMIQEQLQPGMYAEANYGAEENLVFFMDEAGVLRENNAEGAEVQIKGTPITFSKVNVYTLVESPDPAYVAEIEKKYEKLKQDIIAEYTEKAEELEKKDTENAKTELETITSDTSLEDIARRAPALYNKLNKEFNEKVIKKLDSEEYVNMTPEQERNLFEKFIQGDPTAKELIDEYNKKQKLESITKETGEKEEFEFIYQGKTIKTVNLKTINDLEKMKRRFDKLIKDIENNPEASTEDITNKRKYSIISKDLEKLINTRLKAELPEGFRYVEENEMLPAGNYVTKLSVDGKRTITNAPRKEEIGKAKKSDIEVNIGKIPNTEYEVKSNGVYFKDRKLDNPKNLSHKELIAEDIRRRQEEELDILSVADIEDLFLKRNIISKPVGEDFGTQQSMLNAYWNLVDKKHNKGILSLGSVGQVLKTGRYTDANLRQAFINLIDDEYTLDKLFEKIDEGWKMEGMSPNYSIDKINAKYDAEIDALESTSTTDSIPENPQSSDDVSSPTQDTASRKVEVIDGAKRYSINDFKADIAKSNTMPELQQVLAKLQIKIAEEVVALEDLQVMSEIAKQRAAEIKSGQSKIDPTVLEEGTQLIAKDIIFDEGKTFALGNDTLVVKSIDKAGKNVTVVLIGSTDTMSISFNKLNKMVTLKDKVMETTEQEATPITKEEKEMLSQSSDLADSILSNSSELDKLEEAVSKKTVKELDNELLDDLKC